MKKKKEKKKYKEKIEFSNMEKIYRTYGDFNYRDSKLYN